MRNVLISMLILATTNAYATKRMPETRKARCESLLNGAFEERRRYLEELRYRTSFEDGRDYRIDDSIPTAIDPGEF